MHAKKLAAAIALAATLGTFGAGAVVTSAEAGGRASVSYHDAGAGRAGRA